MKPSEIISLARRQTGCTEDIVTEDEAYRFLNFVIEDFGAEIRLSDAGYGLKQRVIDLIAGQNTYEYSDDESAEDGIFGLDKISKVGILQNNGKYEEIPVRFVGEINLNDIEIENAPKVCFFDNSKLTLVPTPKTNGKMIIMGYSKNFKIDEETEDEESKIWIPARRHHVIAEGLKYRMYGNMGVGFEAVRTTSRQFYDSEKLKAIAQLTDRGQMAEEGTEPYLDYLA